MPQSLGQVYVHAVFATKLRAPLIVDPSPERLHAYMASVFSDLGCPSIATGGIEDHVHSLFALGRTTCVAAVMEKIKSASSRWMKQQGTPDFWWQPGYAAFSVGRSEIERARHYILRQPEHHLRRSFEQELRIMCGGERDPDSTLDALLGRST